MARFDIPYETEREGQIDFFANYNIPYDEDDSVLVDNTDGIYNGNIFEFKLNISNLNKTLSQAIKYLSRMRIKGESVPATILLVDLNATTMYVYKSQDYFDDIHKVYTGAASKGVEGFTAKPYKEKYDYSNMVASAAVKKILKGRKDIDKMYMPVNIDENCIVGWAERYYRENPKAKKGDFIGDETGSAVKITGEIREPKHFKGLINPYKGKTNEKFKYLMDCLNDRLSKKDLGAFYTPEPYARKAAELVQIAVDRVPEGNDYIILDRCAGTGNLEEALIGLTDRNGDDLIEHCVVSTYEYYEYKVLQERIGDKVRDIIPPTEADVVYENGVVSNADAMSKEYIENPIIRQYVDNPKCTIILFENPPYHDSSSVTFKESKDAVGKVKTNRSEWYVTTEYKKHLKEFNEVRSSSQELSNLFIWSGVEYYLRYPTDSIIVFSPVKYFKTSWIIQKQFVAGFLFNREHFHATESAISCVLWANIEDTVTDKWTLSAYDIDATANLVFEKLVDIKKTKSTPTDLVISHKDVNDQFTQVACKSNGTPYVYTNEKGRQPIYNDNIVGYMEVKSYVIAPLTRFLVRCNLKDGLEKSQGFHVRKDVYLLMLPLWTAKMYPQDKWYEKDVYATTADGGDAYTKDPRFLKSCLIYTCLSNQNKCLSFDGSDGRRYQNELCFDNDALALRDLNKYAANKKTVLDDDEKALVDLWYKILDEAKKTVEYNPEFNYGVYQITKELNTFKTFGTGKSK